MQKTQWVTAESNKLLKLKINELQGLTPTPMLKKALKEVQEEVKKAFPLFNFSFYISDEWFCADSSTSIAIPFYLFCPELFKLEKKVMGETFEKNTSLLKKIIRHEIGHAIDNAYKLRKNSKRLEIFGNPKDLYPDHYARKAFSKKYVKNLPENYAQAHPDEDFAETFAVWLDPNSHWKTKYKKQACYQKLLFMDKELKRIKKIAPLFKSQKKYDEYKTISKTLASFYKKKVTTYKKSQIYLQKDFKPTGSLKEDGRNELSLFIAKKLKLPKYQSKMIVKDLFKGYPKTTIATKNYVVKHLETRIPLYLEQNFNRIPL